MDDFIVAGTPQVVSRAIEEYAIQQRTVSALVVPWESDRVTLSMSVTAVSGDGFAIEHTNLGTIRLTDLGGDRTRVAIAVADPNHPEPHKLALLFERFARHVQKRFQAAAEQP
jgi:hypothetical protein